MIMVVKNIQNHNILIRLNNYTYDREYFIMKVTRREVLWYGGKSFGVFIIE